MVLCFLDQTLPLLRKQLKQDRTQHIYDLASRVRSAVELGDAHQEWKQLHVLMRYGGPDRKYTGSNELDIRCGPDGTLLEDQGQIAESALRAFAKVEDAQVMTIEDCLRKYNALRLTDLETFTPDSLVVPTFEETLAFVRKAKKGKAPGPDDIPGDVLSIHPFKAAELLHPLIVKCVLHSQEPFAWKLVLAHELYKGSGTMRVIEHFRSIFLANSCAKVLHSFLRQRLGEVVADIYRDTQVGGRPGRDCPMATQLLRTFMSVQKHKGRSATILFLDLKSAFYTAIRQHALRVPTHEADVDHVYSDLALPAPLIPLVNAILREPELFANFPCHLRALVAESHRVTCFTMKDATSVAASRKGTRPGTSLADLLFNLIYTRPLAAIMHRIKELGMLFSLRDVPLRRLSRFREMVDSLEDATYVDDTAIMLDVDNADIVSSVRVVMEAIHEQMLVFGWRLNYKIGKTGPAV